MPALLRPADLLATTPVGFIDHFAFTNPAGTRSTVHFRFDQIVQVADLPEDWRKCAPIVGSDGINRVVIHAGPDDVFGIWDPGFVNWGPEDRLIMVGTSRDDSIWGGVTDSTMYGGAGDDRMLAPYAATTAMYGGSGDDAMGSAGSGITTLFGGDGDDSLSTFEGVATLWGGNGNDRLICSSGNFLVDGGAGDDLFEVQFATACVAQGGDGNDLFRLTGALTHAMHIDMTDGGRGCDFGAGVNVSGFEAIAFSGSRWRDVIKGGSGTNWIDGGLGSDVIIGGASADDITASHGADTMTGGGGQDWFSFRSFDVLGHGDQRDVITDFTKGEDVLDLFNIPFSDRFGHEQNHPGPRLIFIGTAEFDQSGAREVRFEWRDGNTVVQVMAHSPGHEAREILLLGQIDLSAKDFFI